MELVATECIPTGDYVKLADLAGNQQWVRSDVIRVVYVFPDPV